MRPEREELARGFFEAAAGGRSRIRVLPHHGGVTATPTTCYASGPRGALAYQVTGTGPVDLLMVPGMHSHLELQWQLPGYRRFVRGLTGITRRLPKAGPPRPGRS